MYRKRLETEATFKTWKLISLIPIAQSSYYIRCHFFFLFVSMPLCYKLWGRCTMLHAARSCTSFPDSPFPSQTCSHIAQPPYRRPCSPYPPPFHCYSHRTIPHIPPPPPPHKSIIVDLKQLKTSMISLRSQTMPRINLRQQTIIKSCRL